MIKSIWAFIGAWWRALAWNLRWVYAPARSAGTLFRARTAVCGALQMFREIHGDAGGIVLATFVHDGKVIRWRSSQPDLEPPAAAIGARTLLTGPGHVSMRLDRRGVREAALLRAHADHVVQALQPLSDVQALQQQLGGILAAVPLLAAVRFVADALSGEPEAASTLGWAGLGLFASMSLPMAMRIGLRAGMRWAFRRTSPR